MSFSSGRGASASPPWWGARPAQIEAAFAEAEAQVARYASDRALLPILLGDRALKAGMLVFVGAKRVLFRPWDGAAAPRAKAKTSTTGKKANRRDIRAKR